MAFTLIDVYEGRPPHVTSVRSDVEIRRGERLAFLRDVKAPRRVKPGRKMTLRVKMQRIRGGTITKRYRVAVPRGIKPGRRTLRIGRFRDDSPDEDLLELLFGFEPEDDDEPRPVRLNDLIEAISGLGRWDGVELRLGGKEKRAFRDDDLVITGSARATVRVVGKARKRRR
jgi:hypothetical protein